MRPPVICTPLRVEHAAVGEAVRTGMGPVRSAASAAALASPDGEPGPVLVAGVAGALTTGIEPGDVVVASEVRGLDAPIPVTSAPLLAGALRRLGLRVHVGPIVSSPHVVDGPDRAALAATGALAVDMESAWLATATSGGPFAVVRTIVDTPNHPLWGPGTPARGVAALRALRRSAPALRQWAAATGEREILLASPRSFCAGVDRAIEIVERALERYGEPVYVRRQIVHNAHVVRDLTDRGAVFVNEVDEVPEGAVLVFAAHGVAPSVRRDATARGLSVIDATCPLVTKVHNEVRRYAGRGDTVFLIGHRDHEEVEGTIGEAPEDIVVVEDAAQAAAVRPRDAARVSYAMQTTLAVDEADEVAQVLRDRFPVLRGPGRDDICYATTNRQKALRAIAASADLMLVVGSANSSNSLRLVEVAEREGVRAQLVDDAGDVDLGWLAGARRIGITAGASAPPHLVDELVHCLAGLGPLTRSETQVVDEDIRFTLPREVT
jgi:4-hydroxy-3-methylbut-2-enyl diphosphate reductase